MTAAPASSLPASEAGRLLALQRWTRTRWLQLAVAVFVFAFVLRVVPGARTIDDSYITYRYARNLLAGNGFVYNPGERVLGTTTPLYTLLMAAGGLLTGGVNAPFAQNSLLLNALADGLTCLLLIQLGRRLGCAHAGLAAAMAWAAAPFSITFAIGGLETSVYILLLTGAAYAHLTERRIWTAALAALAYLTRPDALILVGLIGLDRLIQIIRSARRGQPGWMRTAAQEALVIGLPVLAWTVFATWYFGSPLPHSMAAKQVAYRLSPEEGLVRLLQHYGTPFLENLTFGTKVMALTLPAYLFLCLTAALRVIRKTPAVWPLAVYPWLYLVVFAAANPLIFRWYLSPPLPGYMLFILIGAQQIIAAIAGRIAARQSGVDHPANRTTGRLRLAAVALLVILPAALSLRDWRRPDHGLSRPAPDMAWYRLELLYRQVADRLAPEIAAAGEPVPVLAAGDVGVLGFFSGARILDTVGLNSPVSTRYYPLDDQYYVINYAIPPDLIIDQQPDYVVILEVYGRGGLLQDLRFQQQYRLSEKIPTDIYGSDGLLVFVHR